MTTPITFNVNNPFIPRIVLAFRALYPDLTAGLTDGQAVKAVIRKFVADTVATYEAGQATASFAATIATASTNWQTTHDAQVAQSTTDTNGNVT